MTASSLRDGHEAVHVVVVESRGALAGDFVLCREHHERLLLVGGQVAVRECLVEQRQVVVLLRCRAGVRAAADEPLGEVGRHFAGRIGTEAAGDAGRWAAASAG